MPSHDTRRSALSPAVLLLILASCAPAPAPEPGPKQRPVPSIKEIEARTRALSGQQPDTQPSPAATSSTKPATLPPLLRVRREEFLGTSLPEPFWSAALAAGEAPPINAQWRRNGLEAIVLAADPLEKLALTLPRPFSSQTHLARLPEGYDTLPSPVTFDAPLRTRYFRPGENEPQTLLVTQGRAQFLVRITDHDASGTTLEIIPHLFEPRQTVRVRQPQDKLLDGRVLSDLTLTVRLAPDQLLLIGLTTPPRPATQPTTRPATQPSSQPADSLPQASDPPQTQPQPQNEAPREDNDEARQSATTQPATGPATQPAATQPAEETPASLGVTLLRPTRFGKSVTALMVIGLVPDVPPRPAAPPR